jgi:filamentous hemagglutinin family protein
MISLQAGLAAPARAQITPSGQTATSVTTAASGKQTVSIAPSKPGGLSYNSYKTFSVGKPGADIDNRTVGARTIVNEVITTSRSLIEGPVAILGSRAHLIVANPNGITIDGGSFINTGGTVLGAGTIKLETRTPAPYLTQTNAVLTTNSADVFIASGGLGGTMASLQIYAGSIKVDGPVKLTPELATRAPGDVQLLAGKSSTEFDSSVLPIAALGNWAVVTPKGTASKEILVDVTSNGSLDASRVVIGVTEKGAGVSYAGKGLASAGDFVINGSGQIDFRGAQITSAGDLKAHGAAITILNSPASQSKLISVGGALTLIAEAGDLRNFGGLLQGEKKNAADKDSKGAVTLTAAGNIEMRSENGARLAVAFANSGDLVVTAGGNVTNTAGRFLSNQATRITAGGTFTNTIEVVGAPPGAGVMKRYEYGSSAHHWWQFWHRRYTTGFNIDYGALAIASQLAYVVGSSVDIKAAHVVNHGGEINANSGAVKIATGNLTNDGVATGSARLEQSCQYWCRSSGSSNIIVNGGRINAATTIDIAATGAVTNTFGQWLALDAINVAAASFEIAGLPVTAVSSRPAGVRQLFGGGVAWELTQDVGGLVLAPNGKITLDTKTAVRVNGGTVSGAAVVAPAGIVIVRPPQTISPTKGHAIGWLSWED